MIATQWAGSQLKQQILNPRGNVQKNQTYQITLLSHTLYNKRVLKYLDLDNFTLSSHDRFVFDLKKML